MTKYILQQYEQFKKSESGRMCLEIVSTEKQMDSRMRLAFCSGAEIAQNIQCIAMIEQMTKEEKKVVLDYLKEELG